MNQEQPIKIAVVGDVHEQWEPEDNLALQHLGVELVLFVGDFGNESLSVVRQVAALEIPKAAIFGNHDAWYTETEWGRSKCPFNWRQENRVQQQLDLLGQAHVGFGKLDFPHLGLTVVGARPFSWGGSEWKHGEFYQERFGVKSFAESTRLMVEAARQAAYQTVIFLGHNGPKGLGDAPEDPCGKDWKPLGGDFGDPDFRDAIDETRGLGKTIPLVAFGHMHHQLRHTKKRLRRSVHLSEAGTVYLNGAAVPRIVETGNGWVRNFSLVLLESGRVSEISLVWVGPDFSVVSQEILFQQIQPIIQPASVL